MALPAPQAPESQIKRLCRAIPRLLLLVCLVSAALLVRHAARHAPVPPPAVPHYTPQQAAAAQQHFNTLRDELLRPPVAPAHAAGPKPATTAPTPQPQPATVRLQLSQSDLNAYLATNPDVRAQLRARGVQAVQVFLSQPHNVLFRATVLHRGHQANVQISGDLMPDPKTMLRLNATSAQIGNLTLPAKLVTAQADAISAKLTRKLQNRSPLTVRDVRVVGDKLVLIGTRRAVHD